MRDYIDSSHKESERHAAYPEQSTAHFEDVVKITANSAIVISQEKQMGVRKIVRKVLTTKMRQLGVLKNRERKN